MTQQLITFIQRYEATVIPLSRETNLAYFAATVSGKDEDYARAAALEIALSKVYSDKDDFATLKSIKQAHAITDPLLKRQLDVLYNAYLAKQLDATVLEQMINLQNATEKKFSTYRTEVNRKKYTDNQIEDILKSSTDSDTLQTMWEASKRVGEVVVKDVLQLVKLRNNAATSLGFRNYHAMQLELSEQDPNQIETLFDELDALTRTSFAELKTDIDAYLAGRLHIAVSELRPWHYQNRFFQEAPKMYDVDLDGFYKDKNIIALAEKYYSSIGLPIDDLVARSDLFEKEGKYQHAYCTDIDRDGDVRVVCNIKPNHNWMNTTLHEFGHAVYDIFNDRSVPWTLREPAHTFTTEAIAMLFGRFASNPAWLIDVAGIPKMHAQEVAIVSRKSLRLDQLTFSHWVQVMYRFEKAMYENPDQNLNALWWNLVERYQLLTRPTGRNAPDWASKIHVALYPAYYHNYMMGELLASQLSYDIAKKIYHDSNPEKYSFAGKREVGDYLIVNIFKPGNTMYWDDMIKRATGERLTAKYYARQFVQ